LLATTDIFGSRRISHDLPVFDRTGGSAARSPLPGGVGGLIRAPGRISDGHQYGSAPNPLVFIFSHHARSAQAGGEAMHDRHKVLDHLALRRQLLVIEHQQRAALIRARTCEPGDAKPCSTVLMRDHERRDFAPLDGVHDFAELLAREIQPAANSSSVRPRAAQKDSLRH
jgi:hypothetical protein